VIKTYTECPGPLWPAGCKDTDIGTWFPNPGDACTFFDDQSAYGIIIAISHPNVTVLWSRPPDFSGGYIHAPYVPLQVTPTIFAKKPPSKP
jgi:hypothetical protein